MQRISKDLERCHWVVFSLWRELGVKVTGKGTWKYFITPSPCAFTEQLNDLHHWAPNQPASVSRQGCLKIALWNDIKLVKHFSAYGVGQGVPYFSPADNFSPPLSFFPQFSCEQSSIQSLQVKLDKLSWEDRKENLEWLPPPQQCSTSIPGSSP